MTATIGLRTEELFTRLVGQQKQAPAADRRYEADANNIAAPAPGRISSKPSNAGQNSSQPVAQCCDDLHSCSYQSPQTVPSSFYLRLYPRQQRLQARLPDDVVEAGLQAGCKLVKSQVPSGKGLRIHGFAPHNLVGGIRLGFNLRQPRL